VATEVLAVQPKGEDAGVVISKFTVRNQRGEDVLVAILKSLVARKPAA